MIVIFFMLHLLIEFNVEKFSNWETMDMYYYFILYHSNAEWTQDMYFQQYLERQQLGLSIFKMLRNKLITYPFKNNRNRVPNEYIENLVLQSLISNHHLLPGK